MGSILDPISTVRPITHQGFTTDQDREHPTTRSEPSCKSSMKGETVMNIMPNRRLKISRLTTIVGVSINKTVVGKNRFDKS